MEQRKSVEALEKSLRKSIDTLFGNSEFASNEYFLPATDLIAEAYDLLFPKLVSVELTV